MKDVRPNVRPLYDAIDNAEETTRHFLNASSIRSQTARLWRISIYRIHWDDKLASMYGFYGFLEVTLRMFNCADAVKRIYRRRSLKMTKKWAPRALAIVLKNGFAVSRSKKTWEIQCINEDTLSSKTYKKSKDQRLRLFILEFSWQTKNDANALGEKYFIRVNGDKPRYYNTFCIELRSFISEAKRTRWSTI